MPAESGTKAFTGPVVRLTVFAEDNRSHFISSLAYNISAKQEVAI